MAYWIDRSDALPAVAASSINAFAPVSASASHVDGVLALTAGTVEPIGVAVATAASPGDPVAVQKSGVAKVIAGASIGPGSNVGFFNATGRVGPVASGAARIGISRGSAVAGEVFAVLLHPEGNS